MNDRIRTIAVVGMVLLAALILGTTYWQAWAESDLAAKQDNAIQRVAQFKIDRGAAVTRERPLSQELRPELQGQHE